MKTKHRTTTLFLAICMVLTMFTSVPVKAAGEDQTEQEEPLVGLVATHDLKATEEGSIRNPEAKLEKYIKEKDITISGFSIYLGYIAEEGEEPTDVSADDISIFNDKGEILWESEEDNLKEGSIVSCSQNGSVLFFVFQKVGDYIIAYTDKDGKESSVQFYVDYPMIGFYRNTVINDDEYLSNDYYKSKYERGKDFTFYIVPQESEREIQYIVRVDAAAEEAIVNVEAGEGENKVILKKQGDEGTISGTGAIPVVIKAGSEDSFNLQVTAYVDGERYGHDYIFFTSYYDYMQWDDNAEHTGFSGTFITKEEFESDNPWDGGDQFWVHGDTYQDVINALNEIKGKLIDGVFVKDTGYILLNGSSYPYYKKNTEASQTITVPADSNMKGIFIGGSDENYYVKDEKGDYYPVVKWEQWDSDIYEVADEIYVYYTDWAENKYGYLFPTKCRKVKKTDVTKENPAGMVPDGDELELDDLQRQGYYDSEEFIGEHMLIPEVHINANKTVQVRMFNDFQALKEGHSNVYLGIADDAEVTLGIGGMIEDEDDGPYLYLDYLTYKGADIDSELTKELYGAKVNIRPITVRPTGIKITQAPDKIIYTAGEKFDAKGMEVALEYADGTSSVLKDSEYTLSITEALKETDKEIVVTYEKNGKKFTAKQAITVKAAVTTEASASTEDKDNENPAADAKTGDTVTVGGNQYTVTSVTEGKMTVTYTGSETKASKVTVPSTVKINETSYKVTAIGNNAFSGNTKLTSVTIPSTVTKIGKNAFKGCTKLKKVTIPKNVTSIDSNAFYNCKKLTSVTFKGTKVTKISDGAFRKNSSLKSVNIPKSVKEIGKDAFRDCTKLSKITFKGTAIKKIGKNAFKNIAKKPAIKVPSKKKTAYKKLLKKAGYTKTVK